MEHNDRIDLPTEPFYYRQHTSLFSQDPENDDGGYSDPDSPYYDLDTDDEDGHDRDLDRHRRVAA
jgi:hypothetical protein